ncbi:ATP synthase subunit O, mitochondrial-like [Anticarsia gemmatalis]|uniref:ATP synthase subunit O, mitochondrial-like n=1 Tax=Anticarsia gemmatalis TaxID=129554 RepID=UPI003F761C06
MFRTFVRNFAAEAAKPGKRPPISVFGIEGRYVTALYSAASQMNQLVAVEKSLRDLQKALTKPKIIDFIETSLISRGGKAKLLKEIATSASMPPAAANFLEIVAENGRLKLLRRMINMFLAVMVAHRNEALCEVITAKPLEGDARTALMEALTKFTKGGKKITLTEKIDESIIGGMIVGVEDKHIDLSIAKKIQVYTAILKEAV